MPRAEYLRDLDILMVYLRDGDVARTREGANVWTNIDVDAQGNVLDVEFVNALSVGVDPAGIPDRDIIERLIAEAQLTFPFPMPA